MYAIYALVDPRDHTIHYVGMTNDVFKRFIQHLYCDGNNYEKNLWISSLKALGIVPIMQTLEIVYTLNTAKAREEYWINHYLHLGMPLTNVAIVPSHKRVSSSISIEKPKRPIEVTQQEREMILSAAKDQQPLDGKVVRTKIRDAMGWNNKGFMKIKQVLDQEGL